MGGGGGGGVSLPGGPALSLGSGTFSPELENPGHGHSGERSMTGAGGTTTLLVTELEIGAP